MIPAAFDYVRPGSVDETVATLAEHGDEAKVLAGGQSLIPLMRFRLAAPGVIVDVGGLNGAMTDVTVDGDTVRVGALATHSTLEHSAALAEACPLLGHVAGQIGDPAIRHRGTIGGSLAHADPASDLPAALLALGGSVVARGPNGDRVIAADDFFAGFLESALAPDELLVEVRVPVATGGWAFEKFNRRAQDWAVVGVAVAEDGAGVGLINMGLTPLRAAAAEEALAGGASASEAAQLAADGTHPSSDENADAEFRRHLARVLTERALATARGD